MPAYLRLLLPLLFVVGIQAATAQTADTAEAVIQEQAAGNKIKLNALLRPLRQVAGAPEAYYSYCWELGDGSYSFAREPEHIYKDTGTYQVRLFATNNYDDGKKPRSRPRPVKVKTRTLLAANNPSNFFSGKGVLEMKTNCMPLPGEDMLLMLGYRNLQVQAGVSGSIMLLYNEKQFRQSSFEVAEARVYHKERGIGMDSLLAFTHDNVWDNELEAHAGGLFTASVTAGGASQSRMQLLQMLKQEMSGYQAHRIFRIEDLQQQEERLMFLQINTLPEMIKDTNAVVTIGALFIPDDPAMEMERFNLELQIVASHDPNRMMLRNRRMNYRFTGKNKNLDYKVRFQNTGKGPAKKVVVTVAIPGMVNSGTVELLQSKPECGWCKQVYAGGSCIDTILYKDSIQFVFNNIYLPGTQQDGVSDPDSTMGFVKYRLHFAKGLVKNSFRSSAAIVFDKNEPIYTNKSVGSFKKGWSPGILAGYGFLPGSKPDIGKHNWVVGATLSEYAPYKRYWQWELYVQRYSSYEQLIGRREGGDTLINGRDYKLAYRERYNKVNVLTVELVPFSIRQNFNSWIAAGAGVLVAAELNRTTARMYRAVVAESTAQLPFVVPDKEEERAASSFGSWRGALFADVQLGRVRVGPVAGLRFLQYTNPCYIQLLLYAGWKF